MCTCFRASAIRDGDTLAWHQMSRRASRPTMPVSLRIRLNTALGSCALQLRSRTTIRPARSRPTSRRDPAGPSPSVTSGSCRSAASSPVPHGRPSDGYPISRPVCLPKTAPRASSSLSLLMVSEAESMFPLLLCEAAKCLRYFATKHERTTANPSEGRESSIYAGFLSLDSLGVRFPCADQMGIETSSDSSLWPRISIASCQHESLVWLNQSGVCYIWLA